MQTMFSWHQEVNPSHDLFAGESPSSGVCQKNFKQKIKEATFKSTKSVLVCVFTLEKVKVTQDNAEK